MKKKKERKEEKEERGGRLRTGRFYFWSFHPPPPLF
jgi:hypothetical protein